MNAATWQDKIFETPTVLLSGHVSGEEEVPVGVQALLLLVSLSHLLSYQLQSSCLISNLGYLWSTCHRQCWYEMLSQHQIFSAIVQCEHETLGCFWHAFGIVSTKFGLQCFANAFTVLPTFNDTMIRPASAWPGTFGLLLRFRSHKEDRVWFAGAMGWGTSAWLESGWTHGHSDTSKDLQSLD